MGRWATSGRKDKFLGAGGGKEGDSGSYGRSKTPAVRVKRSIQEEEGILMARDVEM